MSDPQETELMCTNFKVKAAKDGTVVIGRSLEFPTIMPTALAALPAGFAGTGQAPDGSRAARTWEAAFGVVGMCAFSRPEWLLDGLNTAGLSAHLLYMPGGYCTYQPYAGDGSDISEVDLIAFLLGTCATMSEVKDAVAGINIWGVDPGMGFVPPIHCLVHDEASSIALEFHADGVAIVDNPTGVGTNAPYLDWHLININNYVGLSATNPAAVSIDGSPFAALGQGQGLKGLPGDYAGPSRFIRAVAMVELSDQPEDGPDAEQAALHILNSFDIPRGVIQEALPDGSFVDEVTVWDTVVNLTQQRYAYRTVSDPTVYVVDLATTDFAAPARTLELSWTGGVTPITV
jgi:choloylglycine hydrolase